MRRILKEKVVDKSTEKKKRDALIQSIAVEETVKARVLDEVKQKKDELKSFEKSEAKAREQVEFWKKAAKDAERVFKALEARVVPLHSRVEEVETRLGKLLKEEVDVRQSLRFEQAKFTDEIIRLHSDFDIEERRLTHEIEVLERQKADQEARLMVLSRSGDMISQDLATKEREQKAMDVSLTNRMRELATINMNLAQTKSETERAKRELDAVDGKLEMLRAELYAKDKEIVAKTEEISYQEQAVISRREQLVALSAKEKRIQDLIPAIEALYERAGLKVKL